MAPGRDRFRYVPVPGSWWRSGRLRDRVTRAPRPPPREERVMDTDTSRGGIATPESPRNEPAASRPPEAAEAPARPMPAPQPPYAGGPQAPHPPYPSYPPYQ